MTLIRWPDPRGSLETVPYVTGRLPYAVPEAPVVTTGRIAATLESDVVCGQIFDPIASRRWEQNEQPLPSYVGAYDALLEYLLPPDPIARLERLRASVFDGRTAPNTAYCDEVAEHAGALAEKTGFAAEIIDSMAPAPSIAAKAYDRLVEFHSELVSTVDGVADAAERRHFSDLQEQLFRLTCYLPRRFSEIESQHHQLRKQVVSDGCRAA
ncbi:MAG: hypothetical protein ACYDCQ_18275 [Dehalococcoidia bacterium]